MEGLRRLLNALLRWGSLGTRGERRVQAEVEQPLGGALTAEHARAAAIARARRIALQRMAAYLERRARRGRSDETTAEAALALSASLVQSADVRATTARQGDREVLRVAWLGRLSARDVRTRLGRLLADPRHLEQVRAAEARTEELLAGQAELEQRNEALLASEREGGDREQARRAVLQAASLRDAFAHSAARLDAQARFAEGQALWTGTTYADPERAVALFSEAIALVPDQPDYYFHRGNANYAWRQHNLALRDYDEAIRLNPRYGAVFNNRGNVHYTLGDLERAAADYEQALALNPDEPDYHNNRANAWRRLGHAEEALRGYGEALRLAPGSPVYHNNRAIAYDDLGEHAQALADYDAALAADPAYDVAWFNRGRTCVAMGRADEGAADFRRAIRANRRHAEAYFHLGRLMHTQGRRRAACREWRKAARLGHTEARAQMAQHGC